MINLNLFYTNKESLYKFISQHDIPNDDNVLIQIFSSKLDREFLSSLTQNIAFLLPKANIIGSTSSGEICGDSMSMHQTLISFTLFEKSYCRVYLQGGNFDDFSEAKIAKEIDRRELKAVITFASGLEINGEKYIKTYENENLDVPIAGGLAGGDEGYEKTYVFTKDKILSRGAVAVSLHGKSLHANSGCSFGWEAIGKDLTVTKVCGNKIYEINHLPVSRIYKTYLGEDIIDFLPSSGVIFPLILQKNGISLARFVTAVNEAYFTYSADIKKGEKVSFGFANIEQILNKKDVLAQNLSKHPIQTVFTYSCVARKTLLGQMCAMELEPLRILAPSMCGFFTAAEFYHHKSHGTYEMLNHNLTVLTLSESKDAMQKFEQKDCILQTQNDRTIKALSKLVSQTSRQLNILNKELSSTVDKQTSQLRKTNKSLLKQLYYDDLTGLGNRTLLLKMIKNKQKTMSLILIDINNFKNINDLFGVISGDAVLKQVGTIINSVVDNKLFLPFRVSGDEFAVICKESVDKKSVYELIDTIAEIIKKTIFKVSIQNQNVDVYLSVAIGLAYKSNGLFEHANLALAKAKEEGAPYIEYLHSLELEKNIQDNISWNNKIRVAIANDKIVPYFQPIFTNGEPNKYETLMRLIDDDGTVISPYFFLDIAKKSGDYLKLTHLIVEKACKVFADRVEQFSINLSYEDMADDNCCNFIKEVIRKYNVSNRLIVEIVESEYINNFEKINLFLNELKMMGAKIAIDDFGSGYANFSYLTQLKPHYIKIDGSIMKNIDKDDNALMIAETITMFAKKMGAKTVGEFIHSQAVLEKAIDIGVDSFQGFLLGEPKPL